MAAKVNTRDMWPAAVNLFALGFFLAGLSTLVSSFDQYRWRTIGIVAGIYVVQLIMKIVGLASERFQWLLSWTFFTAYDPERFVSVSVNMPHSAWRLIMVDQQGQWLGLGPLGYDSVLIGMGFTAYVAATVIFCRRDLPAPLLGSVALLVFGPCLAALLPIVLQAGKKKQAAETMPKIKCS